MSRLSKAADAIREAAAAAGDIPSERIDLDDDFIEDLGLKTLELLSLSLIIEEIFAISVPDGLFGSPLYRTANALAEWAIRQSEQASWLAQRQCPRRA